DYYCSSYTSITTWVF
nr:immunoglobulin light chain junction region [Macaca mulatta]MOW28005.1 immunoglobulin light chain junction region [Macaca mulatta]MOW28800.1 immunoglobulin light chain junction region [Macaca mulatta]MOW28958.1 immunoglobulin light chain junction region [Macaca mulatta]MOW29515.1 immunoglobulin light chain junction region [Macaca mulatta]